MVFLSTFGVIQQAQMWIHLLQLLYKTFLGFLIYWNRFFGSKNHQFNTKHDYFSSKRKIFTIVSIRVSPNAEIAFASTYFGQKRENLRYNHFETLIRIY